MSEKIKYILIVCFVCITAIALFIIASSFLSNNSKSDGDNQAIEEHVIVPPPYTNLKGEPADYQYLKLSDIGKLQDVDIDVVQYERQAEQYATDVLGEWNFFLNGVDYKCTFTDSNLMIKNPNEKTTLKYNYKLMYDFDNTYDLFIKFEEPVFDYDTYKISISENALYLTTENEEDGMILKRE